MDLDECSPDWLLCNQSDISTLCLKICRCCIISNPKHNAHPSIKLWQRPKFLRPNGKIYQAINADALRAQNLETWPFFNQVTSYFKGRHNFSM